MKKITQVEIKLRYIFYIFAGIWTIDLISTFLNLTFSNGSIIETNPFQVQFFSLGWFGWILSMLITYSVLFVLTILIGLFGKIIKKIEEKKNVKGYYNFYLAYLTGIFTAFELVIVFNNIYLFLKLVV
jgi:hypothetical protein